MKELKDTLFPTPLYRSFYSERPGQDVLSRAKKMCIPPRVKSFFFKHALFDVTSEGEVRGQGYVCSVVSGVPPL